MAFKKGLGKGLDSMIPQKISEDNKDFLELEISRIDPNLEQPRKKFDEDSLIELSESIRQYGIIQPIIVSVRGKRYEIIAGERRYRAAKLIGLSKIPAIIKEYTEREIYEISLIENIQRQDLSPIEEALAYQRLIDEFSLKQDDLADRVSKSRSSITNSLRLLKLDERVKEMLEDGRITVGHARAILGISDPERQYEIAIRVLDQNLTVRDIERLIKKEKENEDEGLAKKEVGHSAYKNLEDNLEMIFGSKVNIRQKKDGMGKIEISYHSVEELDRLTELFEALRR